MAWLEPWHWYSLGVGLVILELFAPTFFFIWLGAAAGLTGVVLWLVPDLAWTRQLLVFGGAGVAMISFWYLGLGKRRAARDASSTLNRRGSQYIGRTATLEQPLTNGQGRVKIDGMEWLARGPDCPAGTQVRVTGIESATLLVELVDA